MKSISIVVKFSGENSLIFRNEVADGVASALAGIDNKIPFSFLQTYRDISIERLNKIKSGYSIQSIGGDLNSSQRLFFCYYDSNKFEDNFFRIFSSAKNLFQDKENYDIKIDIVDGELDISVKEKEDFLQRHNNFVKGGNFWLSKFDIQEISEKEKIRNIIERRAYVLDRQGLFDIPQFKFPSFKDYPESIMDYLKGQYEVAKNHHEIESRKWDNGPMYSFDDFVKKRCSIKEYERNREFSEISFNRFKYNNAKDADPMVKRLFEQENEIMANWHPPVEQEGPYSGKPYEGWVKEPEMEKCYPGPWRNNKRY